jgi:hypothetical protein
MVQFDRLPLIVRQPGQRSGQPEQVFATSRAFVWGRLVGCQQPFQPGFGLLQFPLQGSFAAEVAGGRRELASGGGECVGQDDPQPATPFRLCPAAKLVAACVRQKDSLLYQVGGIEFPPQWRHE